MAEEAEEQPANLKRFYQDFATASTAIPSRHTNPPLGLSLSNWIHGLSLLQLYVTAIAALTSTISTERYPGTMSHFQASPSNGFTSLCVYFVLGDRASLHNSANNARFRQNKKRLTDIGRLV
jgi:hypothetical protein